MAHFGWLVALISLLTVIPRFLSVRITKFYVPLGASHEAPLECKYDLESAQLYDVKWYKDGFQFFRCLPTGETMEYNVEGIKITHADNTYIGHCSLTLMMLSKSSAGEYRCEVTTERPHFKMATAHAKMRIIQTERRTQNYSPTDTVDEDEENKVDSKGTDLNLCVYLLYMVFIKCFIY